MFYSGCSSYNPLEDTALYTCQMKAPDTEGIKITFLGNTTLHISDGKTSLLVDGFVSRPSPWRTLFWRIGPTPDIIKDELAAAEIRHVDAVLIGHAHHDHALDAPYISLLMSAKAMGSHAYGRYHEGSDADPSPQYLRTVGPEGATEVFGDFTVSFRLSSHVSSHSFLQRAVEGDITAPFGPTAHYSSFKHGDVFVIHIQHPVHGGIAISTTAGSREHQFANLTADIMFLGVGLLAKESPEQQDAYWRNTVEETKPHTVIPIHWDNFGRKLDEGLKPPPYDDICAAMDFVQKRGADKRVFVMNRRDSILLSKHKILVTQNKISESGPAL